MAKICIDMVMQRSTTPQDTGAKRCQQADKENVTAGYRSSEAATDVTEA